MSKEKLKQNVNVGVDVLGDPNFREMTKKENGITLIALIITIIVMLILVGVSVTVALNGGLFSTAQQATNKTQLELDKEQLLMAAIGAFDENGKVDTTKLELPEGFTESNGIYTSKSGNKFTISEYGSVTEVSETEDGSGEESGDNTTGGEGTEDDTTGYAAYVVGDTVTIGTENFYVLKDSDATQEKVTLLAKDNISASTLVQSTVGAASFSSTAYWSDIEGITYPYDLIESGEPDASHCAAKAAYDYGANLGGTGRLMTYTEATVLQTVNSDILYGTNGKSSREYLNYWLSRAQTSQNVWFVNGADSCLSNIEFPGRGSVYIRPVVEISKSNIS